MYGMMLDQIGDYCTLVGVADDMGAQTSGLVNLETYRKFIKPRHKEIFDFIHKKTAGKIYLHSCGNVDMYINDFIEEGIDVLNPVQPECPNMGLKDLKDKYGDKITFCGGVSSQRVLPRGTPNDVKEEVIRVIKAAANGGGFIVAPGHIIQPEVPPWNVCALYDSVIKHGQYPIKL
jgi:uroporphyrinogen decarboxylase